MAVPGTKNETILRAAGSKPLECRKERVHKWRLGSRDAELPKVNQASAIRRMGEYTDARRALASFLICAVILAAAA